MFILGFETSCDETSVAIVEDGRTVHSIVIASQIDIHRRFGGVVPEVASRQHILQAIPAITEAFAQAPHLSWDDIDAVAVTNGPGLAGALIVGVNVGKAVAFARNKPLYGTNHLEGHVYANWLVPAAEVSAHDILPTPPVFPNVCLVVSGGHTELVLMRGHGDYVLLGKTQDDAAGEAYDKVARIMGLSYPGGPSIQKAAETGNPHAYQMPRAWLKGTYDFSFSGLKTAALREVEGYGYVAPRPAPFTGSNEPVFQQGRRQTPATRSPAVQRDKPLPVADIAASFQLAVNDVLVTKTLQAADEYGAQAILLAGGVAANKQLRQMLTERARVPVSFPPTLYCTDNAAMIAAAAYYRIVGGLSAPSLDIDIRPNWPLVGESF